MKITESLVKKKYFTYSCHCGTKKKSILVQTFDRLACLTPFHFNHLAENVLNLKTQQFVA